MNSAFRKFLLGTGWTLALATVLLISARAVPNAHAQEASAGSDASSSLSTNASKVVFPIADLGGCSSKEECRAYCNVREHMGACITFGKTHGLLNKEEADRGEKFKTKLETTGGPGGCNSVESCKEFCSKIANFETCINFSKANGLRDQRVDDSDKVLQYVKGGGKLPGDCTSPASCADYCKDAAHREECTAFAEASGLKRPDPVRKPPIRVDGNGSSTTGAAPKLPEAVLRCVKEKFTADQIEKLVRGEQPSAELEARVKYCFTLPGVPRPFPELKASSSKPTSTLPAQPEKRLLPEKFKNTSSTNSGSGTGSGGGTSERPPVCADQEACRKLCTDPAGQFHNYPDCIKFRGVLEQLRQLQGDVAPDPASLPADNACPDETTCAARCENEASNYFLKPECIHYREEHPIGFVPNKTGIMFGNILKSFVGFFR